MYNYQSLEFTDTFFETFVDRQFSARERSAILKALRLLDADERHRSLNVHDLRGDLAGSWAARADDSIRILFERLPGGRKRIFGVTRHYDR